MHVESSECAALGSAPLAVSISSSARRERLSEPRLLNGRSALECSEFALLRPSTAQQCEYALRAGAVQLSRGSEPQRRGCHSVHTWHRRSARTTPPAELHRTGRETELCASGAGSIAAKTHARRRCFAPALARLADAVFITYAPGTPWRDWQWGRNPTTGKERRVAEMLGGVSAAVAIVPA
ncbi:unnamed protein product [Heligmosomoides polygyrus]|uniref:Uncharacterized protein n=1 Tax=Heligmosomoides polygyrus TaxID=6339 RepID=A0A183FQM8_HELPZ|nr:unnamed protein product [Heligmosomoides polygyrus]